MRDCNNLVIPKCGADVFGYTSRAYKPATETEIWLMNGHGAKFPDITGDQFYYVRVREACNKCCVIVKVTAKTGDVLTTEATASTCDCIPSNATVEYAYNTEETMTALIEGIGINVVSPLKWDACSRTLSINCEELKNFLEQPCGTPLSED